MQICYINKNTIKIQAVHTRLAKILLCTLVFPFDVLSLRSTIDPRNWILKCIIFLED